MVRQLLSERQVISLAWAWYIILLPLPWLTWWLLPAAKPSQSQTVRLPANSRLVSQANSISSVKTPRWVALLSLCAWVAIVLACTRPQWTGEPVELPRDGRQLILAVDVSGSMQESDMSIRGQRVTRLTAVQYVAGEFIKRREGDQIGLVLFGERAYLQSPLTFDRETVAKLLHDAFLGMAGQKTAIGDAIGLSVKRVEEQLEKLKAKQAEALASQKPPVLILLTDGSNNAGQLNPIKATELAKEIGLKIYTIGFGAESGGLLGMVRRTEIDEATLTQIAELSEGRYYRAENTEDLESIYADINKLETIAAEEEPFRPVQELYIYPLSLALALLMIAAVGRQMRGQ